LVQNMGANPNSTQQYNFNLTSGITYHAVLTLLTGGNSNPTGTGVNVTFTQWVPQTVTQNQTIGGLRIKTITNNDGISPTNNITSYSYLSGTQSTGILYSRPIYVQSVRNDNYALVWPYANVNGCTGAMNGRFIINHPVP
jgi:hypothetical protein